MTKRLSFLFWLGAALAWPAAAQAYVGPGAGLSLMAALCAFLAAVGAILFFLAAWPVRKMLRRRRARHAQGATTGPDSRPAAGETRP